MLTILAAGSRGDIQPCLALGIGLQAAGHHVRLRLSVTAAFVEPYGLESASVEADFQAIMGGEDGQGMVASGGGSFNLRAAWVASSNDLTQIGYDFWRACRGTEAIIAGLNGVPFFGYEFADKLVCPASMPALCR
jgi:UDP:flavonoid glycosyltransferase YjiC (YdhE family)